MLDVIYLLLTLAVFVALALLVGVLDRWAGASGPSAGSTAGSSADTTADTTDDPAELVRDGGAR